jgi:type IV pilus assembly protein PilQ
MTPFISLDGYVTLNINPNYSTVKEKVYSPSITGTGTDLAATLLQRRNLELKNIRIKDGETLVIGGMIRENETKTLSKIPVLGDIPGLGFMFRNSATTKEKQELVIMLTPKIIKDSEDVVNNPNATL